MITKAFQNIRLSMLGMGNMRLPLQNDEPGAPIDRPRAQQIINYAMENGINYYDTAYVYHAGESESFVGEALARFPRASYYIATKYHIMANPDYKAVFEEQLVRMNTEYIDFYLIHAVADNTAQTYIDSGCIAYFEEQQRLGRIKYFGFSAHASVETLKSFADLRKWDFGQLQINYYDWKYGTAQQEYEVLAERQIPIVVMEPVRGGRLATLSSEAVSILNAAHPQWSMPEWAFRWLKRLPQVMVVLSGMSNMEQIKENVDTFGDDRDLTPQEEEILMLACDAYRKQVSVPCTGCRYCCDDCPANINIPDVLEVYNRCKVDGMHAIEQLKTINTKGQPTDCIACASCMGHCPQNIDIVSVMQELAKAQA